MNIKTVLPSVLLVLFGSSALSAQQFQLPSHLEKLASEAHETVDVTLDGSMLQLAAKFLSDKDADQAKVKKLVSGLRGVYVRSYEFDAEHKYDKADIDALRSQFPRPEWSSVVGVRSRDTGDNVDVYFKVDQGGQLGGVAVIDAGSTNFTIVNVVGTITPEQLGQLGGQFGISHFDAVNWSSSKGRP